MAGNKGFIIFAVGFQRTFLREGAGIWRIAPLFFKLFRIAMTHFFASLFVLTFFALTSSAADFSPPKSMGDVKTYGRNIQRTMRLLTESTPQHRNTVRILFYGQSITDQAWSKIVANDLIARFPNANIIIENRALSGFASQMLVKTAETDLYPFQPDLLIFHVYGAHDKYEDIIRRTRERTTSEILMQNDHVNKLEDLAEETDPAKVPIHGGKWDAFMNHNWLPLIARKYGAELCDQRSLWKSYLAENKFQPAALLRDGVHLNEHGEFFMAECVKTYLRRDEKFDPAPAEAWVKTLIVGKDVQWTNGRLLVEFEGNRLDLICKAGSAAPALVRIDGRKPSEFAELYGFTRVLTTPEGKWPVRSPVIAPLGSEKLLLVEDWTIDVRKLNADEKLFAFTLMGSKTGPDGEGRSDQRFVSKSGRVTIAPEDWNVAYAMMLSGVKPVPEHFIAKWRVEPRFVDEFVSPGLKDNSVETIVTLAQGLANTRHVLEITSGPDAPIFAVRIYRPPVSAVAR